MSKGKKILIVVFFALIFAFVAGFAIYQYCTPLKTTVYVYNNDYEAGQTITSSMFTPIQVDSSIVINGRNASTNEQYITATEITSILNSGDSLLNNVYKGQTFTKSDLSVASGTAIERNMRSDAIAVTIAINNTNGVTSGLREGSRVNVYTSLDGMTSLFLENMKIIKVNKNSGSLSSVTLECTQEEAVKIIYAQEFTSVYFGLVDTVEYVPTGENISYGMVEE